MNKTIICLATVLCVSIFCGSDWLNFRGPLARNVSPSSNAPIDLGEDENIAWQAEMPGKGPSGPIVVGDCVIVTCSAGDKQDQLFVVCIDAKSGEKRWQRRFWATGRCHCHPLSANAAPTPASDGESIYAFFSSNDLVCLDLNGNLKWFRGLAVDHPKAGHDAGMASSPAVFGDVIVCQVENQGESFAIGINKHTGEDIWKIERKREASWASPLIFNQATDTPLCLLQSTDRATVVELNTGDVVWELEGRGNPIPSTAIAGNRLFIPVNGTTVVEFDNEGNFSEVWNSQRVAAGTASSVVNEGTIYAVARGGILNAADASSGEVKWKVRVGGSHWTTPLIAGNHMYLFAQDGTATVVQLDGSFDDDSERIVHQHQFADEVFLGSPAISGDQLFMRSDRFLYKFAKDPS